MCRTANVGCNNLRVNLASIDTSKIQFAFILCCERNNLQPRITVIYFRQHEDPQDHGYRGRKRARREAEEWDQSDVEESDQQDVKHARRVRHPAAEKPRQRGKSSREMAPELQSEEEVEVVSEEEVEVVSEICDHCGHCEQGAVCVWTDEWGGPNV